MGASLNATEPASIEYACVKQSSSVRSWPSTVVPGKQARHVRWIVAEPGLSMTLGARHTGWSAHVVLMCSDSTR